MDFAIEEPFSFLLLPFSLLTVVAEVAVVAAVCRFCNDFAIKQPFSKLSKVRCF